MVDFILLLMTRNSLKIAAIRLQKIYFYLITIIVLIKMELKFQTKNSFQAMLAGPKANLKMRLKMAIGLFKKQ